MPALTYAPPLGSDAMVLLSSPPCPAPRPRVRRMVPRMVAVTVASPSPHAFDRVRTYTTRACGDAAMLPSFSTVTAGSSSVHKRAASGADSAHFASQSSAQRSNLLLIVFQCKSRDDLTVRGTPLPTTPYSL